MATCFFFALRIPHLKLSWPFQANCRHMNKKRTEQIYKNRKWCEIGMRLFTRGNSTRDTKHKRIYRVCKVFEDTLVNVRKTRTFYKRLNLLIQNLVHWCCNGWITCLSNETASSETKIIDMHSLILAPFRESVVWWERWLVSRVIAKGI